MTQVIRGGDLGQTLSRGDVLADTGEEFTTVQEAENAAGDWILIGPGTFQEAVTVDTSELYIGGSGRGTLIDGGTTGDALLLSGATDVTVANLSLQTTAGQGNSIKGLNMTNASFRAKLDTLWVRDSDEDAFAINSARESVARNLVVEACDGRAIETNETRIILSQSRVFDGTHGIFLDGSDELIGNNIVLGVSNTGIRVRGAEDDTVVIGHRVHNSGVDGVGINSGATDNIIANNRISGSGTTDIDDSGTNTLLDGNRTGAAN